MVSLDPVAFPEPRPVDGYGPGIFRVGGRVVGGALIAAPSGVTEWDGDPASVAAHLTGADLLLYGAGPAHGAAPPALVAACDAIGVAVEAMATGAACRTYNVLLAEGRAVALAALPA